MEGTRRPARRRDDESSIRRFHTNRPAAQRAAIQGKGNNRPDTTKKNNEKRRMPPVFMKYVERLFDTKTEGLLRDPKSVNYMRRYYRNLHHGDSHYITVAKGGKNSVLEKLLMRDALGRMRGKNETERSGWRLSKTLGAGSYGEVTLWQNDLPHGRQVWCLNPRFHLINILNWEQAKLATKDHKAAIPFYRDYNNEGNAVRRLNDAGCKNVIEILDWVDTDLAMFRQIFEYAEFGDFHGIYNFYIDHKYFTISQAQCK